MPSPTIDTTESAEPRLDRRALVSAAVPLVAVAAGAAASAPGSAEARVPPAKDTPKAAKPLFRTVNTPSWNVPGISLGAIVEHGRPFFLSGHVPILEDKTLVGPGYKEQFEQCFKNLQATLEAGGGSFANVIRLTYYIVDYKRELIPVLNEVRNRYIDMNNPPTSMMFGVAALYRPECLVEVEAWAVLPPA